MTTPQSTEQEFDLDKVFDSAGGSTGAPSFQWPEDRDRNPIIGASVTGEITDIYVTVVKDAKTKLPKVNKNGKQMPQVNLTLQTELRNWEGCKRIPLVDPDDPTSPEKPGSEDTGERRIYVKYRMLDALAKAIQGSEQKSGGPRKGAKVAVKVTALQDVGAQNPLPDYEARYKPPVSSPADDMFNDAQAAQQQHQAPPAQQQAQAPAQQPAGGDPWQQAAPAAAGGWSDEPPF